MKKSCVHQLTDRHKEVRVINAKKLLRGPLTQKYLAFIVTLDETWINLSYANRKSDICYVPNNENIPDNWTKTKTESFGAKKMVVGALSGRGPIPLFVVPGKVKINSDYYINKVLKPISYNHLPKLYPGELHRVFIHHDVATSHTCAKTQNFIDQVSSELGVTFIRNDQIMIKSPDASPCDFFGFGYLKQQLKFNKARTIEGVVLAAKKIWMEISSYFIPKVFNDWKFRCRIIAENHGNAIEPAKKYIRKN